MKVPDRLQVKTYLHELRTYFTGHKVQPKQLTKPSAKNKMAAFVVRDISASLLALLS